MHSGHEGRGSKLRVENIHYDLTEEDLDVSLDQGRVCAWLTSSRNYSAGSVPLLGFNCDTTGLVGLRAPHT